MYRPTLSAEITGTAVPLFGGDLSALTATGLSPLFVGVFVLVIRLPFDRTTRSAFGPPATLGGA